MTRIAVLTSAAAFAAALSLPVAAQSTTAKPPASAPAAPASADQASPPKLNQGTPPATARRGRSMASVDARHCLKLGSNMAIHRCAEKYRPH
jgi:hypothetical protein